MLRPLDKITGGPSREELFDALRLHAERRSVTFEVHLESDSGAISTKGKLVVELVGIAIDKTSGHDWRLTMFDDFDDATYRARYNSSTRTGTFSEKINWSSVRTG